MTRRSLFAFFCAAPVVSAVPVTLIDRRLRLQKLLGVGQLTFRKKPDLTEFHAFYETAVQEFQKKVRARDPHAADIYDKLSKLPNIRKTL